MKPIVTIIIPNFNKQEYLEECINSVIKQSFNDWNLIIIDDCSTDDSISLLSMFEKNKKIELIIIYDDENLSDYFFLKKLEELKILTLQKKKEKLFTATEPQLKEMFCCSILNSTTKQ